ncbi:hypothetical protein V5F77_02325 [Xanthobacter sp. DSM 24535]|uniref:hypothetical protein n=1 Tax=Roseixanthobacter psychrophilus TaxID=3119917 RepID=UPI0037275A8D
MTLIAWILALLPAWAVSFGAGTLGLVAVGAIIYGLVPLVPYGRLVQCAGAAGLLVAGWLAGVGSAQAVSEEAALRDSLRQAQQQITFLQSQADALQADSQRAAADAAARRTLEDKTHALEARTPDGTCLDAATSDGVRSLWPD